MKNNISFQLQFYTAILVAASLIFATFTYYQNSKITHEHECAEYGAGLDKQLVQQMENTATLGNTYYKFKNGTCYQSINVTYLNPYHNYASIADAYSHLTISSCDTNQDGASNAEKSLCDKYYQDFDNIFQNIYSK